MRSAWDSMAAIIIVTAGPHHAIAEADGVLIVGYESHSSTISLEAERFESYLRDEGLDHVVEEDVGDGVDVRRFEARLEGHGSQGGRRIDVDRRGVRRAVGFTGGRTIGGVHDGRADRGRPGDHL